MRHAYLLPTALLFAACSLISPYTITFTNESGEVIDPETSTLDFVVSAPTLAYISGVSCEGTDPLDILPLADKGAEASTVHKLPLTLMKDQPAGATCEVTVTAYDKTTTETSSNTIELVMKGIPLAKEGELCGGIAAIQCSEGLTCEMPTDTTTTDASGTCVSADSVQATEETNTNEADESATEDTTSTDTSTETTTSVDESTDSGTAEVTPQGTMPTTTGDSTGIGTDGSTPQNW